LDGADLQGFDQVLNLGPGGAVGRLEHHLDLGDFALRPLERLERVGDVDVAVESADAALRFSDGGGAEGARSLERVPSPSRPRWPLDPLEPFIGMKMKLWALVRIASVDRPGAVLLAGRQLLKRAVLRLFQNSGPQARSGRVGAPSILQLLPTPK